MITLVSPDPVPVNAAPLVGRQRERERIRAAACALQDGRGQLILVAGEQGSGKTALVQSLAAEIAAQGIAVASGRGYEGASASPYSLWYELVGATSEALAVVGGGHGGQHGHQSYDEGAAARLSSEWAREFLAQQDGGPRCLVIDDLQWADRSSLDVLRVLVRGLSGTPLLLLVTYRADLVKRQHRLYTLLPILAREGEAVRLTLPPLDDEAVRELVRARYALTQADEARVLAALRARAEGNPFTIVEYLAAYESADLVAREDDAPGGWAVGALDNVPVPELARQLIDNQLAPLGPVTGRLLAIAATLGRQVALDLWSAVTGVAELALLDVVERLAELGILRETSDGRAVCFRRALTREVLLAGTPASRRRQWHSQAAEFLAASATADNDPLPIAEHFAAASDPRAIPWLIRAGDRALASYEWLAAIEHFQRAAALFPASGPQAGERGWLLYRLGRALRYSDTERGLDSFAEAEVIARAHDERALPVLCAFGRGVLRFYQGQIHWGLDELSQVLADWEALTPEERAVPAAHGVGPGSEPPWGTYALLLSQVGRFAEARAVAERLMALPPPPLPANSVEGYPWADGVLALGLVHAHLGDVSTARTMFRQARAAYRAIGHHYFVGRTAAAELDVVLRFATDDLAARAQLAAEAMEAQGRAAAARRAPTARITYLPLLLIEGRWAEARELVEATRTIGAYSRELAAITVVGALTRAQGDLATAWQIVIHGLPGGLASPPGGVTFANGLRLIELAVALALDAHDMPTARSWLEAHDRWCSWGGGVAGASVGKLYWAQYHRGLGDFQRARALGEEALIAGQQSRQPLVILECQRFLGELAVQLGEFGYAADALGVALSLAEACAAPYERALTLLAFVELALARAVAEDRTLPLVGQIGGRPSALLALDEARVICQRVEAAPALARIEVLNARFQELTAALDEAEFAPPGSLVTTRSETSAAPMPGQTLTPGQLGGGAALAGLTLREIEVLRLVAAGQSNREIAVSLFLSVRTAERHIANIYKKIGAHSKADATAFAINFGLL